VLRQCFWVYILQVWITIRSGKIKSSMQSLQLKVLTSLHGSMKWEQKLCHSTPLFSQFKWMDGLMITCWHLMIKIVKLLELKESQYRNKFKTGLRLNWRLNHNGWILCFLRKTKLGTLYVITSNGHILKVLILMIELQMLKRLTNSANLLQNSN